MPWYLWFAAIVVGCPAVAWVFVRIPNAVNRWRLWRRKRRAQRRWRAYAAKIGKRVEDLTPREKLEAHGLPREGDER